MARSLKDNLISFWPTVPSLTQDMVSPDELDVYEQYTVQNPSISASAVGTYNGTGAANAAVTLSAQRVDYPRNLLVSVTGGTAWGTAVVKGQDQFGGTNTENFAIGTGNGGTTAGSTIFATIGTITWSGGAGNGQGTVVVGYASGTSATLGTPKFGLPSRIGGSADLKFINYINNGTINVLPTPTTAASAQAGTQFHSFSGTSAVAITDTYNVFFKPTKPNYGTTKQTGLGTT